MCEVHRREDVETEDVLVLRPSHLVELALRIAAGVVDEHIDAAEFALRCGDETLHALFIDEVGRY